MTLLYCPKGEHFLLPGDDVVRSPKLWMGRCTAHDADCVETELAPAAALEGERERAERAWDEVDRLRATTVWKDHFDRTVKGWIALHDEDQRRAEAWRRQVQREADRAEAAEARVREAERLLRNYRRYVGYAGHVNRVTRINAFLSSSPEPREQSEGER